MLFDGAENRKSVYERVVVFVVVIASVSAVAVLQMTPSIAIANTLSLSRWPAPMSLFVSERSAHYIVCTLYLFTFAYVSKGSSNVKSREIHIALMCTKASTIRSRCSSIQFDCNDGDRIIIRLVKYIYSKHQSKCKGIVTVFVLSLALSCSSLHLPFLILLLLILCSLLTLSEEI